MYHAPLVMKPISVGPSVTSVTRVWWGSTCSQAPCNGSWADLGGEMRIQRVLAKLAVAEKGCDYIYVTY